jgi:cyclomaltodextrinase
MKNNFNDFSFYHIYPLGLCGAPMKNDFETIENKDRFEQITDWISHIKSLGVNAIYLGPFFESSTHGYDTADYFKVDMRLGNNGTLKKLISEFHSNGIKVIFDAVFNHVGKDFWAFRDVQEKREFSEYKDWFQNLKFGKTNTYEEALIYDCWEGHMSLVKLNHDNQEVRQHLLNAAETWIKKLGADGLRIDAADCINISFLKEINSFCKKIKPDFWIMGEIIHGDYRKWLDNQIFDSVTNYECYKGLYSSFNDKNFFEIAYSLNRQFGCDGIYKNHILYNFVDNHDVNRIGSTLENKSHLYPLHALLFTIPGIPSIYYGSEVGIEGKKKKEEITT